MLNFHTKRNWLKVLSISSLLVLAASCSNDEVIEESLLQSVAKSSKSVELSYNSITASAQQSANPIGNIDDNDSSLNTRWSGNGRSTEVDIDFGTEVTVDYVNIAFHKGDERKAYFSYWYSDNGNNWTEAGSKTSSGNTASHEEFDLTNITARYVRILFEGNEDSSWNSVLDLEIYGTAGDDEVNTGTCNASLPSNRASNASANSAALSWNAISNIDHYNVRYRATSSATWSYRYSLKTNSITVNNLSEGTDYEWQIRSKCGDGSASGYNDSTNTFTTDRRDNSDVDFPHDILGLERWKISLPRNTSGILDNGYAESDEVYINANNNDDSDDPSLRVYSDEFFYINSDNNVVFECPADKSLPRTSTGTSNTRTELREMPLSGNEKGWDAGGSTVREMNMRVRVMQTSSTQKLAFAQIHDFGEANWDDLIRIQIESDNSNATVGDTGRIYVMGDMAEGLSSEGVPTQDRDDRTILENYRLGDWMDIRVTYSNDTIRIYLNGDLKQTYSGADCPSNYFKAGVYNQSMNDSSSGTGIAEFESLSVTSNF